MNPAILLAVLACMVSVPAAHAQDLSPPEKVEREFQKMDTGLAELYMDALAGRMAVPDSNVWTDPDGQTVQVVPRMAAAGAPVPQGLGIVVETTYEELVQATVPIRNLAAIASEENVLFVRLPITAVSNMAVPETDSGVNSPDMTLVYVMMVPPVAAAAAVVVWRKRVAE